MTPRENFLETLLFGRPDRIPLEPGHPRESTLLAWRNQGLAEGDDYLARIWEAVNGERGRRGLAAVDGGPTTSPVSLDVSFQMIPTFKEEVLEHKDGHYIVRDWMGAITEISDDFDVSYLREPKDFVTRKWHKFPVADWADWEEMRWRFDADSDGRFPADFKERCAVLRERDYLFVLNFNGPFWQLREFCGMEGLCVMMCEQPDLVQAMAEFWADFCARVMAPILEECPPDMLLFSEDMAFKEHPMISPELAETYCAPSYRRWIAEARAAGTRLFAIDSDGRNDPLIPLWLDCGINCVEPLEIAAGNDLYGLRESYGRRLAFRGGIDKRAMAAGGERLRDELARLAPLIRDGGFLPSCDHGVPPDISWPNYLACALQLAELTGWLD